ncbi:hypothetical protein HDV00_003970 [Rhizophlyctis rosea]|nr:hypothetical protein HDV00_003970 [Rhizophlyctis rosea]
MPKTAVSKKTAGMTQKARNGKGGHTQAAPAARKAPAPEVDQEDEWEEEDVGSGEEMEIDEDGEEGWEVDEEVEGGDFGEQDEGEDAEGAEEDGEADDADRPAKKAKTAEEAAKDRQSRAEQKKLLQERKAHKPNAGLIQRAKKLWEHLRQKKLKPEDRQKYMAELMEMVEGKAKDIIFKHDASRIVQCALKYGSQEQRNLIASELKGQYAEIAKAQYGRFIVSKVLNYCSPAHRNEVIQNFYGKVRKLIRHREAAIVLEEAYSQFANATQRSALIEEFYGPEFAVFKSGESRSIEQIFATHPAKKPGILKYLREVLDSILEKGTAQIGQISIVHRALLEYMSYADFKEVADMVELLKDHLPHILHTREGAQVAQLTILHAGPKDRKAIIKSFKGLVQRIAKEQYGHAVLLTVFDAVDDTVLIQKAILAELVKDGNAPGERFVDVLRDRYGSRVALYLLCGREKRYQPAYVIKELEGWDEIRAKTSKKEEGIRRQQLLEAFGPSIVSAVVGAAGELIRDKNSSALVLEGARRVGGGKEDMLKAVAKLCDGTVETYQAGLESKGEGEKFSAVGNLKKEADQKKMAEEGLDMSEHVLVSWTATRTLKELLSGGRRVKGDAVDGAETADAEGAEEVAQKFAGLFIEEVEPNVAYWLRRCAKDPHRSKGTAFVFEALLKSGNAEARSRLVKAVKAEKGLIAELEKQVAVAKKVEAPAANEDGAKKTGKRKRKDGKQEGAKEVAVADRVTGIETFLSLLSKA